MALPTSSTAGYTTYAGKTACTCLAKWLPVLERLALAHGYIKFNLDILQLTGTYALSGGTHQAGGTFDIKQYDERIVMLCREMGAPATWMRDMPYADGTPGNTHTHGVLSGCDHNWPSAYQILAQKRGYNGMGQAHFGQYSGQWGYGGLDTHPDPSVYRTWTQGIDWAEGEIARIKGGSKPVPAPAPAPTGLLTNLSDVKMDMGKGLKMADLRPGVTNSAHVARLQSGMWNWRGQAFRKALVSRYGIRSRAVLYDGDYGPMTTWMVGDCYRLLDQLEPGKAWITPDQRAGRKPLPTYPGPAFLRRIGFTHTY